MYLEGSISGKVDAANKVDLLPITFGVTGPFKKPMVMLLDPGSTTTWINKKSLPPGIQRHSAAFPISTLSASFLKPP